MPIFSIIRVRNFKVKMQREGKFDEYVKGYENMPNLKSL